MSIKIEKNVPLPTRATAARFEKYPELRQLEVGDSFVAPVGVSALAHHTRRITKETGNKFIIRQEIAQDGTDLGARVWRKS